SDYLNVPCSKPVPKSGSVKLRPSGKLLRVLRRLLSTFNLQSSTRLDVRFGICARLRLMRDCRRLMKTIRFSLAFGLVLGMIASGAAQTNHMEKTTHPTETATLGGGCFWCTEAIFQMLQGVKSVASGYAGGTTENPTYKEVCTGNTGHAEVIQ